MKSILFLLALLSMSFVQCQEIGEIDRQVSDIEKSLLDGGTEKSLLIERDGKKVAISRFAMEYQTVKVTASFYEDDFKLFKSFYLHENDLIFYREFKIIGDDIARLEEAKSDEMSSDELKRAAKTKSQPEEYYFGARGLFFSRTEGRPVDGEFLKEELDFFLSQFP